MKKYLLTNTTIKIGTHTLHRIVSLKNFADVKIGDFGGFVETERNLSHEGDCWIYGEARVDGNAYVCENAKVMDNACVCDNAEVRGNSVVCDDAVILHRAHIGGEAKVMGDSVIQDYAFVSAHGVVCDAIVEDNARICGKAKVVDSTIKDKARIGDNASISGDATISGYARVFGHADISKANVGEFALLTSNAKVQSNEDFMFNSIAGNVTFFKCDNSIKVTACIDKEHNGVYTFDEFIGVISKLCDDRKRRLLPIVCQLSKEYMKK